jgi:hypothetical protein
LLSELARGDRRVSELTARAGRRQGLTSCRQREVPAEPATWESSWTSCVVQRSERTKDQFVHW